MSKVYIKIDSENRITAVNSSAFLPDVSGWIRIDEGEGDCYTHAQGNYFPLPVTTDSGVYRYKYENGMVMQRSAEDTAADEAATAQLQHAATQEERIAQLEAALERLLAQTGQ